MAKEPDERYDSTRDLARELKVDAVVEGSVLRAEGRVRITAQLIKAETDEHLWAESYERDLRDILSLQSEVARAIAGEIRVKLTPGERERLAEAPAVTPEAHEAYVKGRHFLSRFTVDGARKSLGYFQRAIDIDQGFALAWAGLAFAHGLIAT